MSRNLGIQVLDGAIKLFERPGSWTHGTSAASVVGLFGVEPTSRLATRWCIDGALRRVSARLIHNPDAAEHATDQARELIYAYGGLNPMPNSIHFWNDEWGRTRKETLELLKGARSFALA